MVSGVTQGSARTTATNNPLALLGKSVRSSSDPSAVDKPTAPAYMAPEPHSGQSGPRYMPPPHLAVLAREVYEGLGMHSPAATDSLTYISASSNLSHASDDSCGLLQPLQCGVFCRPYAWGVLRACCRGGPASSIHCSVHAGMSTEQRVKQLFEQLENMRAVGKAVLGRFLILGSSHRHSAGVPSRCVLPVPAYSRT